MFGRIDWKPSRHKIRVFAITLFVAVVFFAALLLLLRRPHPAVYLLVAGTVLSLACYLLTAIGRWVYLLWMAIGYLLGLVMSPVVSALIFYLVLTPLALAFRVAGKDNLRLKRAIDSESYLLDHLDVSDPEQFRRQF
jgi:hypothetical protein